MMSISEYVCTISRGQTTSRRNYTGLGSWTRMFCRLEPTCTRGAFHFGICVLHICTCRRQYRGYLAVMLGVSWWCFLHVYFQGVGYVHSCIINLINIIFLTERGIFCQSFVHPAPIWMSKLHGTRTSAGRIEVLPNPAKWGEGLDPGSAAARTCFVG